MLCRTDFNCFPVHSGCWPSAQVVITGMRSVEESSKPWRISPLTLNSASSTLPLRTVLGTDGMVESTPGDGLPELDTRILGLLLAGLTDQAVANHLGLSMRTVQRRVRALMDQVAAETRLQLGFQASRRGWL